ncbi:MAG TPA: LemA family protein [Armatimonadota bacterium]
MIGWFVSIPVVLVLFLVLLYNGLVRLRVLSDNAWSDIDVQLKRRHDLVPNLVETVKGYAGHEKETLERVVRARNSALSAASPGEKVEAENVLTGALRQLFALAESYPDLKASANFLQLQGELSRIEGDLANARRYYNAVVRDYNTRQQVFPASLVADDLGFRPKPFFEAPESEREPVKVSF